jgi:syntaxin 7
VRDIHEIFTHINELIGEQGDALEHVEENLQSSEQATRNAAEQLRKARDAQDSARRNQILLIMAVVIVVGIIVAVLTA